MFDELKKISRASEASSAFNSQRGRSMPVAVLLVFVVLLSAGSGIYAGASFFAQQAPVVTITTTIYTTTTSWTTSIIWSTVTQVVQGVLTTIEYTTSTSTIFATATTTTASTLTLYTVTVIVNDSYGSPVYGAYVYLDGVLKGTTDISGKLVIADVTSGSHTLTVTKAGFVNASQVVTVAGDTSITITLRSRW